MPGRIAARQTPGRTRREAVTGRYHPPGMADASCAPPMQVAANGATPVPLLVDPSVRSVAIMRLLSRDLDRDDMALGVRRGPRAADAPALSLAQSAE